MFMYKGSDTASLGEGKKSLTNQLVHKFTNATFTGHLS